MKKTIKYLLLFLSIIIIIPILISLILFLSADTGEPALTINPNDFHIVESSDTLFCKDSYLHRDDSGMWELFITGSKQEKGAKQGLLSKDLLKFQEDVFINQVRGFIPSDNYLSFLRFLTLIFNRNLGEHVPEEYREEILAISQFCTNEYDAIGSPYLRQLNFHAAHDIGHTMQQYMLVGCSSFGAWGKKSAEGDLIIARNFDFYVGEDFAKNKIITFASPEKGYRYASIGWSGMIGVLSGINQEGLTVSINAAKGSIPTSAATPISILAREILQYASTIDEAYDIAARHDTFVSESLLIGSSNDRSAAIIEKTPSKLALFTTENQHIICTNHFQSQEYAQDKHNINNIEFSDSKYRYDRLAELIQNDSIDYIQAIDVMRDRYGKGNEDIGIGNEMTLNQSIAHHSVIFAPDKDRMWVSTSPWQSGTFICYDLSDFFELGSYPKRIDSLDVAEDKKFINNDLDRLIAYREGVSFINKAIRNDEVIDKGYILEFMKYNPMHYYTYRILGDYYNSISDKQLAIRMYQDALLREIPYKSERIEIQEIIDKIEDK